MESLLIRLGFTNFQHYKSGTHGYPQCLADAIQDILSQNLDEPVLILEDDVETTGHLIYDQPEGCDAIYFGFSRYGGSKIQNKWAGSAQFVEFSDTQTRVVNMLAAHAVLYVSRRFKETYINALKTYAIKGYYNDVLMSRIQDQYLVLVNRMPAFWQSNRFNAPNDLERVTKVYLPGSSLKLETIPASMCRSSDSL
jgi:hypothetical protein